MFYVRNLSQSYPLSIQYVHVCCIGMRFSILLYICMCMPHTHNLDNNIVSHISFYRVDKKKTDQEEQDEQVEMHPIHTGNRSIDNLVYFDRKPREITDHVHESESDISEEGGGGGGDREGGETDGVRADTVQREGDQRSGSRDVFVTEDEERYQTIHPINRHRQNETQFTIKDRYRSKGKSQPTHIDFDNINFYCNYYFILHAEMDNDETVNKNTT